MTLIRIIHGSEIFQEKYREIDGDVVERAKQRLLGQVLIEV